MVTPKKEQLLFLQTNIFKYFILKITTITLFITPSDTLVPLSTNEPEHCHEEVQDVLKVLGHLMDA